MQGERDQVYSFWTRSPQCLGLQRGDQLVVGIWETEGWSRQKNDLGGSMCQFGVVVEDEASRIASSCKRARFGECLQGLGLQRALKGPADHEGAQDLGFQDHALPSPLLQRFPSRSPQPRPQPRRSHPESPPPGSTARPRVRRCYSGRLPLPRPQQPARQPWNPAPARPLPGPLWPPRPGPRGSPPPLSVTGLCPPNSRAHSRIPPSSASRGLQLTSPKAHASCR